jgi:multidrug efflux pump subunit AcrB
MSRSESRDRRLKELTKKKGPLAWMAANPVAANLLMVFLLLGGFIMSKQLKQEVFPEIDLDVVNISVPYPGASPAEVEQGIILAVEESVRAVEGVKRVKSTASEGVGRVNVELLLGTDTEQAYADVKAAVDRIQSLPDDAERPVVSLIKPRREVISLILHGDTDERTLFNLAERVRTELLADPEITQVDVIGARPQEISVEISQRNLRAHNLTLEGVADRIRQASVELPGGGIRSPGGEVLLRTDERRDLGREFEQIELVRQPDGAVLRLGEVGDVIDGFADQDLTARFEGERAIRITIYRVGNQTPITVAAATHAYIEKNAKNFPPGITFDTWQDWSELYRDRIDLLLRNAFFGLILVFIALGLFLEFRLAFWVTMGIPISFLGAIFLMPAMDVSVNMISLFAFIITLGMVVDDAIVVGENIHTRLQEGMEPVDAATAGVKEVAMPVVFAIMTTVAAFSPLFFVPGVLGNFFRVIPAIVISVLLISLVESLIILPAHLGHRHEGPVGRVLTRIFGVNPIEVLFQALDKQQAKVSRLLIWCIDTLYEPVVRVAMEWRYATIGACIATFLVTVGLVAGGRVEFSFFPKIDGDIINAKARLHVGAPVEDTELVAQRLEQALDKVLAPYGGDAVVRGQLTQIGVGFRDGRIDDVNAASGSHVAEVAVFLVPSDDRDIKTSEIAEKWRAAVGTVPGLESLTFKFDIGPAAGSPIDVQLSHADTATLERASEDVAAALGNYAGVKDIDDGFQGGKRQLSFKLTSEGRAAGLTEADLGRQIRSAFYGVEAVRQQRGRHEVRTYVRLPRQDRRTEHMIDEMILLTPGGNEIPLASAATIHPSLAPTSITRWDGKRVVSVTADLITGVANANNVLQQFEQKELQTIVQSYPGLGWSLEGDQREQRETLGALGNGLILALILIYALLAIPFKSYAQPIIIMSAIPFGLVGAVWGHIFTGYSLSLMSMMGIVALSGIVVNDSLVLIVAVNNLREDGAPLFEAVKIGAMSRFRPIFLTSVTTFLGLLPMLLETSVQARFLVPMAVSLAFGVLFATVIILLLVPALYLVLEDLKSLTGPATNKPVITGEEAGFQEGRIAEA